MKKFLKSVNIAHSYGQKGGRIMSCIFFDFQQCGGQAHKVHETTTFLLVTFAIHSLILTIFSLAGSAINLS